MANNPMIKFLKGTQSAFNAKTSYENGVFYLTEDTKRLYVGNADHTASLLNSAINVYNKVSELPKTPPYTADQNDTFAYCIEENILAIYHYDTSRESGHWVQINSDTQNKDVTTVIAAQTDKQDSSKVVSATITTTVTDRTPLSDAFTIINGDNVELAVSSNGKELTISAIDEKATKSGHYVPVADTSEGSTDATINAASGFVTGVKVDKNGHVVGVTSSEQTTNNVTGVSLNAVQAVGATSQQAIANTVVLTSTVTDNVGSQSDTTTFVGDGATTISAANDTITISSTDRSVTEAQYHYDPVKSNDGTMTADGGNITIAMATTPVVTGIETDGKGHITGVVSTQIADTHNTINSVALTAQNGVLSTQVSMSDGDSKADTIALTINYGEDYATSAQLSAAGTGDTAAESGKWDLDVYTTTQVDAKIANAVGANGAVQIVGTVDASHDLPVENIKTGDTYIVTASREGGFGPAQQKATAGDMFIASADFAKEEGENKISDTFWYYVPAGNEVITMSASSSNGFQFVEGNSNVTLGTVNFAAYDANSNEFQVVANVETTASTSTVSFDMYWGAF